MNSSDDKSVRYLTASDLYNLNDEVTGGHTYVRDVHLLNSAAARPALVVFNEVQFPTLIDKAASLLHSLAYHHLFADGNKRTAQKALVRFLYMNGHRVTWDSATERAFILEVAQGMLNVEQIAERMAPYIAPE
jgi:death-on-curing protein